jgi:CheY-like chemotaxis protein
MPKLNAIILVGSLKSSSSEISNTDLLSEFFAKHLLTYEVKSEIIRLVDYDIRPGAYTRVDSDDWPAIYEKIMSADIVIFATPVWWEIQSSLIQRVIERLDEIHDDIMYIDEKSHGNKIHLLLLDYRLGDMFGDSVARKIKEFKGTKIILISAYDLDDSLVKGLEENNYIVKYIEKPIFINSLIELVADTIS